MIRRNLTRAAVVLSATLAGIAAPAAAHADVIDISDNNVDVYAPINVIVHDVLNCLTVLVG